MSTVKYHNDPDYAANRLNQTVVKNKKGDTLFFVRNVHSCEKDDVIFDVFNLVNDKNERVSIKEFVLEPFPLGFTYMNKSLVYLARFPYRTYKQGIYSGNVNFTKRLSDNYHPVPSTVEYYKIFLLPALNDYPPFSLRKEMLKNGFSDFAVNRDVFVTKSNKIIYRTFPFPLGKVFRGKVVLFEDKFRKLEGVTDAIRRIEQ